MEPLQPSRLGLILWSVVRVSVLDRGESVSLLRVALLRGGGGLSNLGYYMPCRV